MNAFGDPRRLLILALVLLISGFAGSVIVWHISGGGAFLATQEGYGDAIFSAASGNADIAFSLAEKQWDRVNRTARLAEAHAHLLFLCIFIILFALLLAGQQVPRIGGRRVAWLAIGGVLIYPAGLAIQAAAYRVPGQVLSAAGALFILVFAGSVVAGLLRQPSAMRKPGNDPLS